MTRMLEFPHSSAREAPTMFRDLPGTRNTPHLQGVSGSPLGDSNPRPLPYHARGVRPIWLVRRENAVGGSCGVAAPGKRHVPPEFREAIR